jgi:hypothetical protein
MKLLKRKISNKEDVSSFSRFVLNPFCVESIKSFACSYSFNELPLGPWLGVITEMSSESSLILHS